MTREEFAARFREAREDTKLSQTDAAARLGIPRTRLAEYELGMRVPPVTKVVEFVVTLGLDPRTIFPEFFRP